MLVSEMPSLLTLRRHWTMLFLLPSRTSLAPKLVHSVDGMSCPLLRDMRRGWLIWMMSRIRWSTLRLQCSLEGTLVASAWVSHLREYLRTSLFDFGLLTTGKQMHEIAADEHWNTIIDHSPSNGNSYQRALDNGHCQYLLLAYSAAHVNLHQFFCSISFRLSFIHLVFILLWSSILYWLIG